MKWMALAFLAPLYLFAQSFKQEIKHPKYEWMNQLVQEELKAFQGKKIRKSLLNRGMQEKKNHVRRYIVKDNRVEGEGSFKKTLEFLTREVGLPDLDLLYFEFDGPVNAGQIPSAGIPIFSGSKNQSLNYVFLVHDPTFHQDDKGNYDWKDLYRKILRINQTNPWEDKIEKLIWRGANTGPFEMYEVHNWKSLTRGRLVYLSILFPEMIDARFSYIHPWKTWHLKELKEVLPQAPSMDHAEQIKYKYQIVMDGDTCTYPGFQWRLLCNSVLFKPSSPLIMWFDKALVSWKHYIPVKQDLSDLEEKVYWALFHDEKAKEIADEATLFSREFLSETAVYVYCYKILIAYAALLEK